MDPLLEALANLWRESGAGDEIRLIGGLAVRSRKERIVKLYPYVVFAERMRGFDTLEEAKEFARANVPSVICERQPGQDGTPTLVEILRHDYLYDEERREWRTMIA